MSRPLRIILVEDSPELLNGWRDVLSLEGHEVVGFTGGRAALADGALRSADVLVSDYYLPDLNGLEVVRRAQELRPDMPAVILTGSREAALVDGVRRLKNVRLIHKPVGVDELESALQSVVDAGVTGAASA